VSVPRPPTELASELADEGWGDVTSTRQSLTLILPKRGEWDVVDEAREPWLVLSHRGTGSELRARTWLAPRLVTAADCEKQARLWRPQIPEVVEDAVVRRELRAPEGYSGQVVVGVLPAGDALEGYAVAFGASVGRCYAAIFTTRTSGPGSDHTLGKRLALVTDGVIERVRARSIEDRVDAVRPPR
jgi:hypothetical protein